MKFFLEVKKMKSSMGTYWVEPQGERFILRKRGQNGEASYEFESWLAAADLCSHVATAIVEYPPLKQAAESLLTAELRNPRVWMRGFGSDPTPQHDAEYEALKVKFPTVFEPPLPFVISERVQIYENENRIALSSRELSAEELLRLCYFILSHSRCDSEETVTVYSPFLAVVFKEVTPKSEDWESRIRGGFQKFLVDAGLQ